MLDTLKIAKRLQEAKLSAEQAEAIAESIAEVVSADLATKADLKDLEMCLSDKIIGIRTDLMDRMDLWAERIYRIFLALLGMGVLTWVLQIFGTNLKHFF